MAIIPSWIQLVAAQLPFLLGFLFVAAAGFYGLSRPYKLPGLLALLGAGLGLLAWLATGLVSLYPFLLARRARLGPGFDGGFGIASAGACLGGLVELAAWALIAAALVLGMRGERRAHE